MTKKKTIAGLTFAAVAALAVPAFAHRGANPEEREARHAAMLQKYDANKDGTLSDEERAAARKDMLTTRFQMMDTNKDGVVSFAEFEAAAPARGFHHWKKGMDGKDVK